MKVSFPTGTTSDIDAHEIKTNWHRKIKQLMTLIEYLLSMGLGNPQRDPHFSVGFNT
jgi:hypothetical protein